MTVLNTSDPFNLILLIIATILLVFLGKETKKSLIPQLVLLAYLVLLIVHVIQLINISQENLDTVKILTKSLAVDFALIAISFFSYLWIDDIEAKFKKKKSIDNSLDWFWKKV